jgi:hypothetical protein
MAKGNAEDIDGKNRGEGNAQKLMGKDGEGKCRGY